MQNIKHLIEKEPTLSVELIKGLLRIWPITNPAKESVFLNEIEEIYELQPQIVGAAFQTHFGVQLLSRITKCI